MHMADALLSPTVATTMYVASGLTAAYSIKKFNSNNNMEKLPVMGVTSALVFAGQMINYAIPGTGSSGHMCGGILLSALLGPYAGFISMVAILAIQCLLFADGGLMALGANCWNMGFYGCFVGFFLILRPLFRSRLFENREDGKRLKIIIGSIIGGIVSLQLGAFSVVLETSLSNITELPFGAFVALMQPIHLAIGLVEGLITAAVLTFVYEARPELLGELLGESSASVKNRVSKKTVIACIAVFTLLVGCVLSLFASGKPDGLEWALFGNAEEGYSANMALDEEDYGLTSSLSDTLTAIQDKTAILPDYSIAGSDDAKGTSLSGAVGVAVVSIVVMLICLSGTIKKKEQA